MSDEELIRVLKEFETTRVEKLNDNSKRLFYAIMKIADERDNLKEENQRLKNIIYTTLEYVDREEVSSVGTPFTSTSIGKEIKELLEGEKTFNSIWEENQRLNNVLNELEKWLKDDLKQLYRDAGYRHNLIKEVLDKINELKESDK